MIGGPPEPERQPGPTQPPAGEPETPPEHEPTAEPEPTAAPEPAAAPPAAPPGPPVWPRVGAVLSGSLDLVTAARIQIRNVSLYYGALGLLTTAPFALSLVVEAHHIDFVTFEGISGWTVLAGLVALLGALAISIESRLVASAILGGARTGRPLSRVEAVRLARRVFWGYWWPGFAVELVVGIPSLLLTIWLGGVFGTGTDAAPVGSNLLSALLGAPFIYLAASIVLGGVRGVEALRRTIRLARARWRLAVIASVFAVVASYLLAFAASAGVDLASRALEPFHNQLASVDPADLSGFALVGIAVVIAVFAYFSLSFTIEALTTAPQIVAFLGLTGYSQGLDADRERSIDEERLPRPAAVSRPMLAGAIVAWIAAVLAIAPQLR